MERQWAVGPVRRLGEDMSADELLDRLRALVGVEGPVQVARHPVNAPAIADWCDAIGDDNPCYTDEDYAAKSRHGGLVAPPATLDIWDRPGLPAQSGVRRPSNEPRALALRLLDDHGYVGVVAVNSELEVRRYLRPGDVLQNTQLLEDVSDEKQTALGIGHFLTTRHRFTTTEGEHVGDLLFRILKFKPGTGSASAAAITPATAPDPSPALRPRPGINRDNAALWEGYRRHELRLPRCEGCGDVFFPPTPRCARCGGFAMGYAVASGRGKVYSYNVVHQPQVPGFSYPLVVALVELDEGPRMVANLVGCPRDRVAIGMPVEVEWLDSHPAQVDGVTDSRGPISLPQFRPAVPPRRTETLLAGNVNAGDVLPVWALPVTATRIVAGALATRDFQDVHHDRDLAVTKGSKDIFFNINTSIGYLERYVTDWSGPEVLVTALRVRLGAPAHPGTLLSFAGAVESVDRDNGRVVVAARATNELGPHLTGTVELELPQ